jgi:hypothetical protein
MQCTDDNLPGRAYLSLANYLMSSVVATPAAALLLVVAIVVASESLVTSVLAALMTLTSCLVATSSAKAAIRASLSVVELLLEVSRVAVSALLRLGWRKGRSWSRVGCRSWSIGLRKRWAWSIGGLRVTEWLQVITSTRLIALIGIVVLLVLTLV